MNTFAALRLSELARHIGSAGCGPACPGVLLARPSMIAPNRFRPLSINLIVEHVSCSAEEVHRHAIRAG